MIIIAETIASNIKKKASRRTPFCYLSSSTIFSTSLFSLHIIQTYEYLLYTWFWYSVNFTTLRVFHDFYK